MEFYNNSDRTNTLQLRVTNAYAELVTHDKKVIGFKENNTIGDKEEFILPVRRAWATTMDDLSRRKAHLNNKKIFGKGSPYYNLEMKELEKIEYYLDFLLSCQKDFLDAVEEASFYDPEA